MKHLLALIGLMPLLLYAQTDEPMPCGTPDGELIKLLQDYGESSLTNGDSVGVLMVKIYVLSNSLLRPYPHLEQQLIESIDEANQFFQGSGIQFALCGEPEYVDSIHYNGTGYHDWLHQHVDPRFINIMSASIPYVCGVANLGGTGGFSNTGIVCNNGEVVSHEFGHLFGLYHTFSFVPGTNMTGELVDGSNCDTTGDGICDTSADPFPHGGYLDSCAYVGAVTDSNGQLYDPPINNLMSYYNYAFHGCGTEAFTEGQFERMRGILHQDLFHLMKLPYGMSLPEISGAPSYICVGDSTTFSLSANPPGGVFSGDGISGDSLFLGDLPVGSYEITYELPPAQPVTPYSKTDYIQFVYGYGSGPDTNVWWQSFRAGETAMMEALRLRARATIDEPFQWTIYAGIGVQGAQLYHQADTFTASDALRWRRFSLDSLFQQTGDSVYTLAFWADSSTTMQVDMANAYGAPFQLPGSISGLLGPGPSTINYHPCFATEIRSTTPLCNEPLRKHIHIIEPLDTDYTIEDNYCMETGEIALETLLPEEAVWTYVEFDFQVNNQIDSILRLDELGVGQHTVLVINEDFRGCTVDKSFPIQIFDVPLVEVADTFCQVDAPFSLTDLWPDGMYWLDGWAADSIFPDQLTAGTHELDMYLPNVFDTLRIADQELTRADSGLVGANFGQDTIFWQSFRPDSAYFFQSASMRIGVFDTIEMVSELWRGPVGTGTLLLAETRTLIPDPYVSYPELIRAGTLNIPMVPDSLYTLVIRPITFFGSPGSLLGAKKNLYPDGEGYPADSLNPNVDWLFRIFHQKERHCGSNRQHIFEVQAQPNAPLTFLSGPDSVLLGTTTTYTWDGTWADDLLLEIPGATCLNCPPTGDSLIVEWNTVGEQEIRVVATNACGQEEVVKTVWVETATSLNADRLRGGKVFPNPFNSGLTIQLNLSLNGNMHLEFYDLKGSLIETQQQHLFPGANRSYQFSTEHLPQGAYMLQIRIGETLSRHLLTKE